MTMKWYVGCYHGEREAFRYATNPTGESHGDLYGAVIGPFKTKRAALWAAKYGRGNPHFRHVDDAERLSRYA